MSTRDALQAICEARFRDTSNDIVLDADWVRYLDQANRHVNRASPLWPWLEKVTDDTLTVNANARSVALPTDVVQVNSVYNKTDDFAMRPFQGRAGMYTAITDDEQDIPQFYRVRGSVLEVFPRPLVNTDFRVEVLLWPGDLASGTTEPPYPETFHDILVDGAMALAYQDDGNLDWYSAHWSKFESSIERMKEALLTFRNEAYAAIRDTWWS